MTQLSGSAPRPAIFLRVATSPVIRLWVGFGDFSVPANDIDVGAETYKGLGALTGLPALQQLLNGAAERVTFGISGVPAYVASLADGESTDVFGAEVKVGYALLDEDWQVDGSVVWIWDGIADVVRTSRDGTSEGDQNHSVALSVGTAMTGRRRPDHATWTDAQHQRAHPGDLFFNNMPTAESRKKWPA